MKQILLILSMLVVSTQINAAPDCKAKDLNGDYVMYQNSVALANLHTGRCEIHIQNGLLSGTCTFTATKNGVITPGFSGPANGTATINTNCSAIATISFDPIPGSVHVDSNFDLQFTSDKKSFIGQWTNNFGLQGTSAGTRYAPRLSATPSPVQNKHNDSNEER